MREGATSTPLNPSTEGATSTPLNPSAHKGGGATSTHLKKYKYKIKRGTRMSRFYFIFFIYTRVKSAK